MKLYLFDFEIFPCIICISIYLYLMNFCSKSCITTHKVTKPRPCSGMHVKPKLAQFCDFVYISCTFHIESSVLSYKS